MNATAIALTMLLLNPVRLYFQPDQPVLVKLDAQAIAAHLQENDEQPASLRLVLLGGRGQVQQSVPLGVTLDQPEVQVDLATLFPGQGDSAQKGMIWDGRTHYVQLVAGGKPIGTPLVVVPLRPPGRGGVISPNALRIYPEALVRFQTSLGDILVRLDPEAAPNTTMQFSQLVQGGFYTNVIFHRIIPRFVIQGGDPTGTGTGGPGFFIDLEPSTKPHTKGTISMARQGNDINSSGSQFFICLSREACQALDQKYTAFGDVVHGLDVVDRIAAVRTGGQDRPTVPPVIRQATLVLAPARPLNAPPASVGSAVDVQMLDAPAQPTASEPATHAREAIELLKSNQ